MRARSAVWDVVGLAIGLLLVAGAARAGVTTGCCLREFELSELAPGNFCFVTNANTCFQFAGVGLVTLSFEPGAVCASDGRSCIAPPLNGIALDIGLGRPPDAPELPGPILLYPSFDSGAPATIRTRAINQTSSTLTHVTLRIFNGDEEVVNDENVPFTAVPTAGFLIDQDTTLPETSQMVGVLVCWADGEMGPGDCPAYPNDVNGTSQLLIAPQGPAPVQVFVSQAFGVFLQNGAARPAPLVDALGLVALATLLLALGMRRGARMRPRSER